MMRYSFPRLFVLACTSLLLVLAGCDQSALKEESKGAEETPTPTEAEKRINAALDAMAKDVAAALENRSVRTLVKKETGELLAGQHNVLYETIASKKIGGQGKASSKSFEEVLAGQRASLAKEGKALSRSEAVKQVREDAASIPKFDVGVPVHHKQWNPKETTPLVAFYHRQEIDDTEVERMKAYDAEGNVHWLDAQEKPERPVVVVGINERTTADGKVRPAFKENEKALPGECVYAKCGGGGSYTGGGDDGGNDNAGEYCDDPANTYPEEDTRYCGNQEHLNTVRIKEDYDNWGAGDGEFYAAARKISDIGAADDWLMAPTTGLGVEDEHGKDVVDHDAFVWEGNRIPNRKVVWFFYEWDDCSDNWFSDCDQTGNFSASGENYSISKHFNNDCDKYGTGVVAFKENDDKKYSNPSDMWFKVESGETNKIKALKK